MDELNQWYSQPFQDPEDELAYMYQQEQHSGMQQQFVQPLPEQQQYYTSPVPPMEPNLFRHHSHSPGFPRFGGPALRNLPFGAVAEQGHVQQSSSSIFNFSGQQANTLTFSEGAWPEAIDGVPQAPEKRSRAHWNTREHVIAERRRRDRMQQQFVALASIVPDLTKTDKITLIGSTIKYVKQLEEKVKTLEDQRARQTSATTIFESKCRISTDNNATGPCRSASGAASGSRPTVEASVHGDTVLLKICCQERRGVLVMVISELEKMGMSIINTSVLPFTDSFLNMTITAKTGEGFSTTVELVKNLTTALRSFA